MLLKHSPPVSKAGMNPKKANKQWVWIAMDKQIRQIIVFHVGDRSHESAQQLWANLPAVYREQATFYTNQYAVYTGIIRRRNTKPSRSTRGKPTTSSVSTTRCGGASPVSSGTLWPSPKSWRTMSGPSNTSYAITTGPRLQLCVIPAQVGSYRP
jgi:IS1 family transposase